MTKPASTPAPGAGSKVVLPRRRRPRAVVALAWAYVAGCVAGLIAVLAVEVPWQAMACLAGALLFVAALMVLFEEFP